MSETGLHLRQLTPLPTRPRDKPDEIRATLVININELCPRPHGIASTKALHPTTADSVTWRSPCRVKSCSETNSCTTEKQEIPYNRPLYGEPASATNDRDDRRYCGPAIAPLERPA